MYIGIIFAIKVNIQISRLTIISCNTESMTVNKGKKYRKEVDTDRFESSLFLSSMYLKYLKLICYASFIINRSLEFANLVI